MRVLYFDIDGTILLGDRDAVKERLGGGAFERAVRAAGFDRLVCVGNFAAVARMASELNPDFDPIGVMFGMCLGAFQDEGWMRSSVTLVPDAYNRGKHIDLSADWWYVDDLADHYMDLADLEDIYRSNLGTRICKTDPLGDGDDILRWLANT